MADSYHPNDRRRPLSDEQIEMIAYHTERGARKAVKHYLHGALLGFLILLLGNVFAITYSRWKLDESRTRAISDSCVADKRIALGIHRALDGQIAFVKSSNEPPPPTIDERVMAIRRLQASIPVPDCEKRLERAGLED